MTPDYTTEILRYEFISSFVPWLAMVLLCWFLAALAHNMRRCKDLREWATIPAITALVIMFGVLICTFDTDWTKILLQRNVFLGEYIQKSTHNNTNSKENQ